MGEYFFLSYLPKGFPERIEELKVCLWLGSGKSRIYSSDMMSKTFQNTSLRWLPFSFGQVKGYSPLVMRECVFHDIRLQLSDTKSLTSRAPSRLIDLGMDVGTFETHAPNAIIQELLHVNQRPCVLFIRWPTLHTLVTDAASQLSFSALAQNWINDLCQFLEDAEVNLGDAVPASRFQEWYACTLKYLREADPKRYLFDPTLFLARLLIHLHSTLYTINHLDINCATKSGGAVFVPLCFIRCWKEKLLSELHGDMAILRGLISD